MKKRLSEEGSLLRNYDNFQLSLFHKDLLLLLFSVRQQKQAGRANLVVRVTVAATAAFWKTQALFLDFFDVEFFENGPLDHRRTQVRHWGGLPEADPSPNKDGPLTRGLTIRLFKNTLQ